jgi:tetratricopeptide (TPR) repeat protein
MLGTSRVVAALCASLLIASPALAQPGAQPTPQQKQQAGDLVKQAITKSQNKDHEGAIELYLKAYAIVPMPTLLSNIGTEYQSAQKPVEALKYFCLYLEKEPTGSLAGYATSQAKSLYFLLGGKNVDEKEVCKAPVTPPPAAATTTTTPDPGPSGEPTPMNTDTPKSNDPGKGFKTAGYVAGGAGLLALGVGFYFGSEAQKISDDITNHTDTTVAWRDDIKAYEEKGQRAENLQIAFLVAGGALVLGGAALYIMGRSKKSSTETMVLVPTASAESAGLVLSGGW